MFCWSTCVDLFIGLELDGHVKGFMGFYFVEGEPYLNSSHGTMINYWDGTVHYLLQLGGVALYTMQCVRFYVIILKFTNSIVLMSLFPTFFVCCFFFF
jgi:hypothetical protein